MLRGPTANSPRARPQRAWRHAPKKAEKPEGVEGRATASVLDLCELLWIYVDLSGFMWVYIYIENHWNLITTKMGSGMD